MVKTFDTTKFKVEKIDFKQLVAENKFNAENDKNPSIYTHIIRRKLKTTPLISNQQAWEVYYDTDFDDYDPPMTSGAYTHVATLTNFKSWIIPMIHVSFVYTTTTAFTLNDIDSFWGQDNIGFELTCNNYFWESIQEGTNNSVYKLYLQFCHTEQEAPVYVTIKLVFFNPFEAHAIC